MNAAFFGRTNKHLASTSERHFKVWVDLPADTWHGHAREGLWCSKTGPNTFKIRNNPFYAFGLSYNDEVEATSSADPYGYVFSSIARKGGHSTYRCMVFSPAEKENLTTHIEALNAHGSYYESAEYETMTLFAFDVPPEADVAAIYRILEQGLADGTWDFEEADYCRPGETGGR